MRREEVDQIVVGNVSRRDQEQLRREPAQEVGIDEVPILGDENALSSRASESKISSAVRLPSGNSSVCIESCPCDTNSKASRRGSCASMRNFTARGRPAWHRPAAHHKPSPPEGPRARGLDSQRALLRSSCRRLAAPAAPSPIAQAAHARLAVASAEIDRDPAQQLFRGHGASLPPVRRHSRRPFTASPPAGAAGSFAR